jgi:CDP-ribitol ribitolphosphotransferase
MIPVREERILFATDSRKDLSGNLQWVHDRMKERYPHLDVRYLFKEKVSKHRPWWDKVRMPWLLATAGTILIDDYYPVVYGISLRKNTQLIQLWHAVGAFKTFGYSRVGKPGGPSPSSKAHRNYTKAIVSAQEVAKYYAEGFGIPVERVVATGIPRTDVFFDEAIREQTRASILRQFPAFQGKQVILFAPTFRGNGAKTAYYDYDRLDFNQLYDLCKEKNAVFILKIHPFVDEKPPIPEGMEDVFFDLSHQREINDLLFLADVLITDYSSTCFEYALLGGPMLFYAYDLEEYISQRDFYYPYKDFVPGRICQTMEELLRAMHEEDYQQEKVAPFRHKYFDHTDGRSTDRVVDLIMERGDKKGGETHGQ